MRYFTIFVAALAAFVAACSDSATESMVYNAGVSRELAEWRKATMTNVCYELRFDLIDDVGRVAIAFDVEAPQEVVIDFRNTALVRSVEGMQYRLENEHIVIPSSDIRAGHNEVVVLFDVDYQSLNSNPDFVYTLLVPDRARTLFPCFDQPDMKARYSLSLVIPEQWVAVSNTAVCNDSVADGRREVTFAMTEPLSTYLFSFVAGRLQHTTYDDGRHSFTAYYRETDPKRLAQLDTIFAQVAASLEWLEEYTDIAYPFAKYDLIMLPGFQYGGMEHTGATLYNDAQMFLGDNPTLDEELRRTQLIAHETAHMWFGDYVTMEWFDDVWTKEIFANYFAARMTEPLFPNINHRLNRLKTYTQAAYNEDRTSGRTAIRQELDNLNNAGLIYGQIIYNKAPIVMDKIVEIMGDEPFRKGIQEYLRTYAYDNASWGDLVAILDKYCDEDLATFSRAWVEEARMPIIEMTYSDEGCYIGDRESAWRQRYNCYVVREDGGEAIVEVDTEAVLADADVVIPNIDGRGYGLFVLPRKSMSWMMQNIANIEDELMRQSMVIMLNEMYEQRNNAQLPEEAQRHPLGAREWLDFLLDYLPKEQNYLIASTLNGYLARPMLEAGGPEDEARLLQIALTHDNTSLCRRLKMTLAAVVRSEDVVANLYDTWLRASDTTLNESDYMTLACELAVRLPEHYDQIYNIQLERIANPDRRAQFEFVMRGAHPDAEVRDAVFESLMEPANRRPEPWAATLLGYLNHSLRQESAQKYIYPALDILCEVQRTGDIFFPRNWAGALLGSHTTAAARQEAERFFEDNPDFPKLLKNKVLQSMWLLESR